MRIGRLRVIFKLPSSLSLLTQAPANWPKEPLAYIEWYKLSSAPGKYHNMYTISKPTSSSNPSSHILVAAPVQGDIVSIRTIRQSCQLIPASSSHSEWPSEWTSTNVLDTCSSFLLNNWSSKYAYQTLY